MGRLGEITDVEGGRPTESRHRRRGEAELPPHEFWIVAVADSPIRRPELDPHGLATEQAQFDLFGEVPIRVRVRRTYWDEPIGGDLVADTSQEFGARLQQVSPDESRDPDTQNDGDNKRHHHACERDSTERADLPPLGPDRVTEAIRSGSPCFIRTHQASLPPVRAPCSPPARVRCYGLENPKVDVGEPSDLTVVVLAATCVCAHTSATGRLTSVWRAIQPPLIAASNAETIESTCGASQRPFGWRAIEAARHRRRGDTA